MIKLSSKVQKAVQNSTGSLRFGIMDQLNTWLKETEKYVVAQH